MAASKAANHSWKYIRKALDTEAKIFCHKRVKKLYMKDGLFAINKPYNLPVHSGPKLKNSIMDIVPRIEQRFGISQGSLHLANRLDQNTSGVLLMTYTDDMARYMADAFTNRRVEKQYFSILVGVPQNTRRGELKAYLAETKTRNGQYQMSVVEDDGGIGSKHSLTKYQVLDNNDRECALVRFTTNTGVKNQIRVIALELLGCPVLGDHKYHDGPSGPQMFPLRLMQLLRLTGSKQRDGQQPRIRPWQRADIPMHLVAQRVTIPGLGEDGMDMTIEAPLPMFFRETLARCNLSEHREEIEEREIMRRLLSNEELRRCQMIEHDVETRKYEEDNYNTKEKIIREYIKNRTQTPVGGKSSV